jgi:hypothetical protein
MILDKSPRASYVPFLFFFRDGWADAPCGDSASKVNGSFQLIFQSVERGFDDLLTSFDEYRCRGAMKNLRSFV